MHRRSSPNLGSFYQKMHTDPISPRNLKAERLETMNEDLFWQIISTCQADDAPSRKSLLRKNLEGMDSVSIASFCTTYRAMQGGANSIASKAACLLLCDGFLSMDSYCWFLDTLIMGGKECYYRVCGCADLVIEYPFVMS